MSCTTPEAPVVSALLIGSKFVMRDEGEEEEQEEETSERETGRSTQDPKPTEML